MKARSALLITLALLGTACGGGGAPQTRALDTRSAAPQSSATGTPKRCDIIHHEGNPSDERFTGSADLRTKSAFELVMTQCGNIPESPSFIPSRLLGSPGERIRITLINQAVEDTVHNFSLNAQHIDTDIAWHKSATLTVTFPSSGRLYFYCKYHVSEGQTGELISN